MTVTRIYHIERERITLPIRWSPDWLNLSTHGWDVADSEVKAPDRQPLSLTETSYPS